MTVHNIFPVQVQDFTLGDESIEFVEQLSEFLVRDREEDATAPDFSIRGKTAHHTGQNLLDREEPWVKQLQGLIVKLTNDWRVEVKNLTPIPEDAMSIHCWGMVMDAGDSSVIHNHPGCNVCGTMWLKIPPEFERSGRQGQFIFMDPVYARRIAGEDDMSNLQVEPKAGAGIVFDPWLEHYVEPHFHETTRLSIAWNVSWIQTV